MIDYAEQSKLFTAIGKLLNNKTEVYVIGGSAMLYYKAKTATKDIDIVTSSKHDFEAIKKALEELGFRRKNPFINIKYSDMDVNRPIFLEHGDKRVDIFLNNVICFEITDTIKSRVTQLHEYGNLKANIVSPEDIILMKCATERQGDRLDAKSLIESFNMNWDIVISEADNQHKIGHILYVVLLYDFLEELRDEFKVDIPKELIKRVRKISEKGVMDVLKRQKKEQKRN